MKKNRIQELESFILHHKELYYRGKAEISDEAYDQIEEELRSLDPHNSVLELVGYMLSDSEDKIPHQKKMLSLDKTYSETDLLKWIGKEDVLSILKIDGSSCSLIYQDGILKLAKTRGDGQLGENITKKVMFIPSVPKKIKLKGEVEIRGEVFCYESNFFELTKEMEVRGLEKPTSQRNIVAGILGRKENIYLAKFLNFKAFDIISDEKFKLESEKLKLLKMNGFDLPDYDVTHSNEEAENRISQARNFMSEGDYLTDGLVFVYNKIALHEELGETSHHPRYKLAFKFAGDTKVTKIESIEWGVSRNGILTPVAHVSPVELSGAMISRVTLHNFGMVRNFELAVGDEIEIIRSGEVIPKFLSVVKKSKTKFTYPELCPSCNQKIEIVDIRLLCKNSSCPAKVKEEILNYIKNSGMEDLSDKRLEEMIRKGFIKDITDLYQLTEENLLSLDKVKEKMATKILTTIEKSKEQNLSQFIAAIGIEGVSTTKCEKIINHGYQTIEDIQNLDLENMMQIEGFAEKSSTSFIQSLESKRDLIANLKKVGVKIKKAVSTQGSGNLNDQKFCITGELSMPRNQFEKLIKENGGTMVSSVSKNTTYLITNEKDGTSSKYKNAIKLNIPIVTEDELLKMIGK